MSAWLLHSPVSDAVLMHRLSDSSPEFRRCMAARMAPLLGAPIYDSGSLYRGYRPDDVSCGADGASNMAPTVPTHPASALITVNIGRNDARRALETCAACYAQPGRRRGWAGNPAPGSAAGGDAPKLVHDDENRGNRQKENKQQQRSARAALSRLTQHGRRHAVRRGRLALGLLHAIGVHLALQGEWPSQPDVAAVRNERKRVVRPEWLSLGRWMQPKREGAGKPARVLPWRVQALRGGAECTFGHDQSTLSLPTVARFAGPHGCVKAEPGNPFDRPASWPPAQTSKNSEAAPDFGV